VAAQFDAASDRVSCASAPNPASGVTFVAWFRIDTDRNDFSTIMRLHAAGGGSTTLTLGTGGDGVTAQVFSAGGTVAAAPAVVGDWYRVAYTIAGTDVVLYLAAATGPTAVFTGAVSPGATPDGLTVAGRSVGDSDEPLTGTLGNVRLWSGAVSNQDQVEAEWAAPAAVRASGLWADWPLAADLLDASGNGRHLSAGTTAVAFVDGPPLPADAELSLGPAAETDTAVAFGTAKARAVGQAATVETAQPLGRHKRLALGTAYETATAPAVGVAKVRGIAPATETATALGLGADKRRLLSPARETDMALLLGEPMIEVPWPPDIGPAELVSGVAVGGAELVDVVHVGTV
jgi:concanavalin A-like lectin/glucanase superfamily protein